MRVRKGANPLNKMASATGLPERVPARESSFRSETEPLLGRPGDAVLPTGASIMRALFIGTGIVAQIGVLILCCDIWAHICTTPLIFFSGHPISMSIAIFTLTQSTLIQQPITLDNPEKKRTGQYVHAVLNLFAFVALVTGFTIIEINKVRSKGPHFHSIHAFFGVFTLLLLSVQYIIGSTVWLVPSLYGGEARAKSLYKYHRYSGYFIMLMILATAVTATVTDYNKNVLGVKSWTAGLGAFLIVLGMFPRIQKQKMGLGVSQPPVVRDYDSLSE